MLTVRLTRDMRPWRAGDTPPLPDDLARQLVAAGEAEDPRPYPPVATPAPAQLVLSPHQGGRPSYLTRKASK